MLVMYILLVTTHISTIDLVTRQAAIEPVTATIRHTLRLRVGSSIGTSLQWWRGKGRNQGDGAKAKAKAGAWFITIKFFG